MDSESLDRCIQAALSALYPPFQETSPTVLCQVLHLVENCYRGDGLRYLIHFLLPAKQLLTNLQQDACAQYCGLLFRYEGWPLCVHEKIVIQLCPLDPRLLRPGDFYLLVSPPAAAPPPPRARGASCRSVVNSFPRLLLCSASARSRHVEQQEVSEIALRSLFSMAWLDSVNREREQQGASRLNRCLLSAHGDVFRVPWEDLVYPQFINKPRTSKESTVKDGDMLIHTTNKCENNNTAKQDVKLLPSEKTDQSQANSDDSDSEGEYVELSELPLPRFSPQKGSLTQSISLQHRARTSSHTPQRTTTNTHSTVSTNTHKTNNTPSTVSAHTPLNTHTLTAATVKSTQSSGICTEIISHTSLCSSLIEENFSQDSNKPVILTPISTTSPSSSSSSSSAPKVVEKASRESERWTAQEPIEGTDAERSTKIDTEITTSAQQKEEEEERDMAIEREEGAMIERQEEIKEIEGSGNEGEEKEDLLLHKHAAKEAGENEEQEYESEESEDDEEEGNDDLEEDEAEEVEVEEEVQVIIVQQCQERSEEEQVRQEEARGGEQTCQDQEVETHAEGFFFVNDTEDSHSEESNSYDSPIHMHAEDSYFRKNGHLEELNTPDEVSEGSYSEKSKQHTNESHLEESYTPCKLAEDSYFENIRHSEESNTPCKLSGDSYSEETSKQTYYEDSYFENNSQQAHSEDLNSQNNTHLEESGTQHKHSEDSYYEMNTFHNHPEDSYSEKETRHTSDSYSYLENTPETQCEDSYFENNTLHPEDSYSEKGPPQTLSGDSYSERNTVQTHSIDSYSEKKIVQTHSLDSQLQEPQTQFAEQNKLQKHHKDSESTLQILSNDSYSEKNTVKTQYDDSYSEKQIVQKHTEDSYSEKNTLQSQSEDSFSENATIQKHSESCFSEKNTLQKNTEDSYCEKKTQFEESHRQTPNPDSLRTQLEESENVQEELEENEQTKEEKEKDEQKKVEKEEEECCCEEVGGGRTSELQTEGCSIEQQHVSLSNSPRSSEPEKPAALPPPDQSDAQTVPICLSQSSQSQQSSFYSVLLNSAALCLPGTRDRNGRSLVTVCTRNNVWSHPDCDSAELLRLLLYYTSTLRKEVAAPGLTVLVDARRAAPTNALFSALRSLQENIPGSIHTVLLLVNKDSSLRLDKPAALQVEVLSSLKSVQKHVELRQLPAELGGSFSFSQSSWLCFRSRVEHLTRRCEDVIGLLQKTINILQSTPLPAEIQEVEQLLSRYKAVMRSILEDSRLVQLQQEGGALLSRLRREESSLSETDDYRVAVETVSTLYDEVDEMLHRLVTLSNSRTQELNFILEFKGLEQGFNEVRSWLEEVGEGRLQSLNEPDDSLELLNKKQQDFKDFHTTAYENCKKGEVLLSHLERWSDMSSADLQEYEVKVHDFWAQLQDFSQRVKNTGKNIERAFCLYRFLDQAYGWALEGMRHLAGVSMEECTLPEKCPAVIGCLEEYQRQHPPIPDSRFQEMKALAEELRGERGLRQWSFAWSKCQETKKMFDRKMEAALRTRDSAHRQRSDSALSRISASSRKSLSGLLGAFETASISSSCPPEEDNTSSPPRSTSSTFLPVASSPVTPQHTPLLTRLFRSTSIEESSDRVDFSSPSPSLSRLASSPSFTPSYTSSPSSSCASFSSSSRRQHLRKTQSFDCPSTPDSSRYGPNPRALSEPVRRGNTGVFIRGLEVSSSEAADNTLCPRTASHGWAGQGICSPGTPGTPRTNGSPSRESRPRGSKLWHVVEEMVATEREYVRSLAYIIRHYFPMMDRADVPQDLRGKRSVVFGNLEKLLDFHSQFFLKELEACKKHPLRVPHCFLRHQEQFSLYALYSKNKPKSDTLLALHGHSFFRRKQVELGDKMDLSSYLLKPIQRMSKYALLLTDLMKEVGAAEEAELVTLQAATKMVKFQLRHGNDLLAMDAIRDCDVNLKEQGQLIRQDEFTVWTGRRKCQRHVFLFDELVLFSKPKKMEGGLDVFIYKNSFKTADVGLTETTGDSGLRFEIWFRRRTSKNQTFILQPATAEVKHAWTSDIARILWTQATKNKEMRLKEMVSMGVGNKPFLDIQPSDAAISDRAVHYIMKSRGARTRASIAVSVFDHSNPFKRGAVTSDPSASGPSSSSLLGPLNLHMYSQTLSSSPAAESSFMTSCIEEDEQEHETSSQPSMTTESSGSSSRCLSGSTGSDSGCVSSHLQEALPEEPSPPSQPSFSSSSSSCSSFNKKHLNSQYISAKSAPVISPATIV